MKRIWFVLLSLILMTVLLGMGSVPASAGSPDQWMRIPFATADSPNNGILSLEVFKDHLYAGSQDYENGLRIWRMEGNGSWTQMTPAGFGDPLLSSPLDLIEFKGMLYVLTGDWQGRTVGQIWRSADGRHWKPVTTDGFGQANGISFNRAFVYKGKLYVTTLGQLLEDGSPAGMQIWRSASGAPGSWKKVVTGGLGNPVDSEMTGSAIFKGALYIAVQSNDWLSPSEIWRSVDGVRWERIMSGFGYPDPLPEDAAFGDTPGSLAVFGNYLYLGLDIFDINATDWEHPENNIGPGQIWRSKDGLNWEPVMLGGFGNWRSWKVDGLTTFHGQLYAWTWTLNWASWENDGGVEVWRSKDGLHWTQVNEDGFGDPNNWVSHEDVAVAQYKGKLFFGTLNDVTGGQIWSLRP
jgi:hypothetical protein